MKVYRQMGIEKNIYWVERAHVVTFDATRVNNLPALDHSESMLAQAQVFGDLAISTAAELPSTPVRRPVRTFTIPGGTVQAFTTDTAGLIGHYGASITLGRIRNTGSEVTAPPGWACQSVASVLDVSIKQGLFWAN